MWGELLRLNSLRSRVEEVVEGVRAGADSFKIRGLLEELSSSLRGFKAYDGISPPSNAYLPPPIGGSGRAALRSLLLFVTSSLIPKAAFLAAFLALSVGNYLVLILNSTVGVVGDAVYLIAPLLLASWILSSERRIADWVNSSFRAGFIEPYFLNSVSEDVRSFFRDCVVRRVRFGLINKLLEVAFSRKCLIACFTVSAAALFLFNLLTGCYRVTFIALGPSSGALGLAYSCYINLFIIPLITGVVMSFLWVASPTYLANILILRLISWVKAPLFRPVRENFKPLINYFTALFIALGALILGYIIYMFMWWQVYVGIPYLRGVAGSALSSVYIGYVLCVGGN